MLLLSNRMMFPLYAPVDTGAPSGGAPTGSGAPTGGGKEDMIEFLGQDDDTEVIPLDETKDKGKDKDKEKGKEKDKPDSKTTDKDDDKDDDVDDDDVDTDDDTDEDEDDDVDDLAEIEQELEGPTEEQLELVTPVRRREILKKYPNLFKDFPYLEKAYYREQQFTEMFPTIQDAKEASEKSATLDKFERDIMGGNTEVLLNSVKKESPNSFNKIVDNYLITLSKVDEKAYLHVVGNTIKHTIAAMVAEARRTNNENLQNAALLVNQFTFGSSEYTPPKNLSTDTPETNKADDAVKQRERDFTKRQFETTRDDLNTRVGNSLKATIEANIDPRNSMSDYVKKNASREALETVTNLIAKDTRFKNLLDRLWEHAFEKNFDKASVDRIRSAYVSKAKTLLPSVIKKARIEALKGMGKRVRESDDTDETTTRNSRSNKSQQDKDKPSSRRNNDGRRTGKITNAKDIPAGMKSIDFLMAED